MTATPISIMESPTPWLRSRHFDLFFIIGITLIAMVSGSLMVYKPMEFLVLAQLNVLLLATPHVIATYTRIGFDRRSMKDHFMLVLPVPLLVLAVNITIAYSAGAWLLATIYFYWQWWHYTRQSYGISRMYLSQVRHRYDPHPLYDHYALYAIPLCGILYRSYQQPASFLGMELYTLPIPLLMVYLASAAAGVLFLMQLAHWIKAWRLGSLPAPYLLYIASHYLIFVTGYMIIGDINYGWLVLNIWHNMQYLAFTWLYNNRRFRGEKDPEHALLSDISHGKMVAVYFFICIFLAAVLNKTLQITASTIHHYNLLPWLIILSMSVNFHHYVVDAVVWKRKRRSVYA